MIISFYDKDLILQDVISEWVSLLGVNTYNDMGSFTLELQESESKANIVKLWQYCTIDNDNEKPYVVTSINITDGKIILTGFPCTYIFSKRASDTVISNQNAEQAMHNLVENMSPWDNLITGDLQGLTDVFKNQTSDGQILDYLQKISQTTDIGFRVVKRENQLVFECYKPTVNENIKYTTSLRNVADLDYLLSENDYYNYAIVAGSEEGADRNTVTVMIGNPTGTSRRELYVDARNEKPEENETTEEYRARLERIGLQKLAEHLRIETLFFSVSNDDDVRLGDIIDVSLDEYNIILQVRVVEEQLINENNTTSRLIGVGTPLKVRRM